MFGAWQAGAWKSVAERFQPDLVVGASVGSLNGYAIASGMSPQDLAGFWRQPGIGEFSKLPQTIRTLMKRAELQMEYAAVVTELFRLKPRIYSNSAVTWRHLAASCAIPLVLRQYKIDGRWCSDGGLLNPLPVWAAVELGATQIVALHALPEIPALLMRPFVQGFRSVAGHNPALPPGVSLTVIQTPGAIGSMRDALSWNRKNADKWLDLGYRDAQNTTIPDCSLPQYCAIMEPDDYAQLPNSPLERSS
jgi:NTE family protein